MNGQVLDPEPVGQQYQQACLLVQQGKMDEAALLFQQCLHLKPDHVESLINLGFIRGEQGKHDEALELNRRALLLKPQYPELFVNMGNALREKKRYDEAAAYFKEAIRLKPDHAKAYLNLGICLSDQWRHDEACAYFRQAIQLQPSCFEAYNNLGAAVSLHPDRLEEAIALYRQCLKYKPDFAEAHWNLALALLLQGNYEEGWREFEWRWQCKKTQPLSPVSQPRWDGSPLEGKSILLHWEQGLGDTLHFIRYAELVKERGGRVLVFCQKSLPRLLARCAGIDLVI